MRNYKYAVYGGISVVYLITYMRCTTLFERLIFYSFSSQTNPLTSG